MDMIPGTAAAWHEAITDRRVFDDRQDPERFRIAFRALAGSRGSWPSPRDFLDALPPRRTLTGPPRLESDDARMAGMHACAEICRKLNIRRTEAGYVEDPTMLAGIAGVVLLIVAAVALVVADNHQWQEFSVAHHCKMVSTSPGDVALTYVATGKGGVGTTFIPGKDGFLCDDGIVHYRDN